MNIVEFLDVTLNLNRRTYYPYKKSINKILYSYTLSNHPPLLIKHLPTSINKWFSKNSSNDEIFNKLKADYEKALKDSGFQSTKLKCKKKGEKQGIDAEIFYGST